MFNFEIRDHVQRYGATKQTWQRKVRDAPLLPAKYGPKTFTDKRTPAKSRIIIVRLLSMAATGYFYTFTRPRTSLPMSMLKYDPIGTIPLPFSTLDMGNRLD